MAPIPRLRTRVTPTGISLELGSWAAGHGRTLSEAGDDLTARLLTLAIAFRASGFRPSPEAPQPDRAYLDYLWELGEMDARGQDIRESIFGPREP
jgi:hypothetical protein